MGAWRTRTTLAALIVLALAMGDILIDAVFEGRGHVFKVAAGHTERISGKLMGNLKPHPGQGSLLGSRIEDPALLDSILAGEPTYPSFQLRFLELSGRLWRAELTADGGSPPGDYPVRVYQRGVGPDPDIPPLTVRVFADAAALRASQASFFRRLLGVAPGTAAGVLLPVVLFLFYGIWRAADGDLEGLQAQGYGPIYKMAHRKTVWEISYGLGTAHGLRRGDRLDLVDGRRRPTGYAFEAGSVGAESGEALLDAAVPLKPGWMVARRQPDAAAAGTEADKDQPSI
jgi:hypothetical protein